MDHENRQKLQEPCSLALRRPLRVNNVARRLRRTERMIRHLAETRKLEAHKIDGKSWGFWPEDVERFRVFLEARDASR